MLNTFLESVLFNLGSWSFTVGKLIGLLLIAGLFILGLRITKAVWRIRFYNKYNIAKESGRKFEGYLRQLLALLSLYAGVKLLDVDAAFYKSESFSLNFSLFIFVLILLALAKVIDWILSNVIAHSYKDESSVHDQAVFQASQLRREEVVKSATSTVRYILVVMSAIFLLRNLNLDFSIYDYESAGQSVDFKISKILVVALIILGARLLAWLLTNIALYGVYRNRDIDEGSQFAINQILKYIIYLIAIFLSLNSIGINMTLVLGGAAALLVGIGLGLQQTFNDFFSGLVLLFERSVSVGDILTVNGVQGSVKKIGMRSSIIETLGNRNIIIPNSKLVNENVLNWNHFDDVVRFDVAVGVAYGSDTALVKKLLVEAVSDHLDILKYPYPFVRFNNFGNSSLDFTIYFFSDQLITTENLKSDVRFNIDRLFRENNISIPFPQTDVWLRK